MQPLYNLFAVDNHSGSLSFGHYTAFMRHPVNRKWYDCNDTSVTEERRAEDVVSKNAYLLFYMHQSLAGQRYGSDSLTTQEGGPSKAEER